MEKALAHQLTTLGHPHRLAVFRLLMRRYPQAVAAREIGDALGIKPSTLSAYLAALQHAGFIRQDRQATSRLYSIDMENTRQMSDALFLDCCGGRPDLCGPRAAPAMGETCRVLFVCTGNSARSILAEAILHRHGGGRFEAVSAGTSPRGDINPLARALLDAKGHDTGSLRPKTLDQVTGAFDIVLTVCDRAANEDRAPWPGQPLSAHWGMPDPAHATGPEAEVQRAFETTYDTLRHRIGALLALPVASLGRETLQQALDEIGRSGPGDRP